MSFVFKRLFATDAAAKGFLTGGRLKRAMAIKKAERWLDSPDGLEFKFVEARKFVTGSNYPFPMNPLFKPAPPITDAIRSEIYLRYEKDPVNNPPVQLAKDFEISIDRVAAILRLKALQKQMEKTHQPVQVQLTFNMEKMLCGAKYERDRIREPVRILQNERLKPLFQFIGEADAVSPEDAANLLELEPYENVKHKLDKQAENIVTSTSSGKPGSRTSKILNTDRKNKSKFMFEFCDISKLENRPVYIRERNGILRTASKLEIYKKKTKKTKFFM